MKNERLLSLRNQMKEAGVHCMVITTVNMSVIFLWQENISAALPDQQERLW